MIPDLTTSYGDAAIGPPSNRQIWPNLFLIGAPRAGSTAVYTYLQQHPQVYMTPSKEPGFFAVGGPLYDLEQRHKLERAYFITSIEAYQALFRHRTDEIVIGDATPHYLYDARVPLRIMHYAPGAKIVAILRSPAARLYSHYMMGVRDGSEKLTFEEVVHTAVRVRPSPPPLHNSYYYEPLKRYFAQFPAKQLKIILYDDLLDHPVEIMQKLYRFLDVEDTFVPDIAVQPNRSGVPQSRLAHAALMTSLDHRLMKYIHLYGPAKLGLKLETFRNRYFERWLVRRPLSRETELALNRDLFRQDIQKLQALIGRDLSHWLE